MNGMNNEWKACDSFFQGARLYTTEVIIKEDIASTGRMLLILGAFQ